MEEDWDTLKNATDQFANVAGMELVLLHVPCPHCASELGLMPEIFLRHSAASFLDVLRRCREVMACWTYLRFYLVFW